MPFPAPLLATLVRCLNSIYSLDSLPNIANSHPITSRQQLSQLLLIAVKVMICSLVNSFIKSVSCAITQRVSLRIYLMNAIAKPSDERHYEANGAADSQSLP